MLLPSQREQSKSIFLLINFDCSIFALQCCINLWKVKVLVTQSCLTLCDPWTIALPGCCVHGILQAELLVRVAMPFSRGSSQSRDWTQLCHIAGRFCTVWATRESWGRVSLSVCYLLSLVQVFVTPWTVAHQAPFCTWNSPGKNTGVSSHSLLQGIFPIQGLNPGLLHCR